MPHASNHKNAKPFNTKYILHNIEMESVSATKYLVVTITDDLSWIKHIDITTKRQTKLLASLKETFGSVTPWNWFKPYRKIVLLTVPRRYFFCRSFVLLMYCVCHAFASVHCCLVVTRRERADLLALVCDVYCDFVTFPIGILGQVWYLIVLMPEPCCLSYFP